MPATRKRSKNTALIRVINDEYQEMLRSREHPTQHLFFDNAVWWKQYYADGLIENRYEVRTKPQKPMDLSGLTPKADCKFSPTKTLTKAAVESLYTMISTQTDFAPIRKKLIEFTNYAMPATRTTTKGWKQHKGPRDLSVMILGAGPVGLFTALYLNELYNKEGPKDKTTRKVNILVIDNRIEREGFKSPYSRSTQFGFDIADLQYVLKNIFCWDIVKHGGFGHRRFDYIHIVENLLYTVAFHDNIPMLFTKQFEDLDNVKAFARREKIHALFDCTGGRIKKNVVNNIPWPSYSFKKGTAEVKYNPDTGYYEFLEKGALVATPVMRLQLLDKHHKEIMSGNGFPYLTNAADIELVNTHKNICYGVDDFLRIASHFKDSNLQQYYPELVKDLKKGDIHSIRISSFTLGARHSPFAAAPLSKDCIYIRVGDSLGSTEYGSYFGMRHSVRFSKYICTLMAAFL